MRQEIKDIITEATKATPAVAGTAASLFGICANQLESQQWT